MLLLARLVDSVLKCFSDTEMKFQKVSCYTDSMICLSWVQAVKKEFKTFVQNRVIEIRDKVDPSNWYYCPTQMNPADVITRLNVQNMTNKLWFEGPQFLRDNDVTFDYTNTATDSIEFKDELKNEKIMLTTSIEEAIGLSKIIKIQDYSNILKLFRVTAYVSLFVEIVAGRQKGMSLGIHCTAEEINAARLLWIKENQKYLLNIENFKQMAIQLNIVKDDGGILRDEGRMKNAPLPFDTKAPVVSCKEHHLCKLIVDYCHLKVYHCGIKQTIVEIRSRYYISKIRQYVKKQLNGCIVCNKLHCRPLHYPSHSDLPKFRFYESKAFNSVGVDYLGPLLVLPVFLATNKMHKVHVALYTCAATRGI